MNKELSVLGVTMSILLVAITTSSVTAQNATTNVTDAVGDATKSANTTMSEVGKNVTKLREMQLKQHQARLIRQVKP